MQVIDFEHYARLPYPEMTGNHIYETQKGGRKTLKHSVLAYRAQVRGFLEAQGLARIGLAGPLWVEWLAQPPDQRGRDEDNLRKVVQDALTLGGLWADDSNKVIRLSVFRWGEPVKGGVVHIWVRPHDEDGQEGAQTGQEGVSWAR